MVVVKFVLGGWEFFGSSKCSDVILYDCLVVIETTTPVVGVSSCSLAQVGAWSPDPPPPFA